MPKNPFDKFKAKKGELTIDDLHPSITLTTEEFREVYAEWLDLYGASLMDDEVEHLLMLIGVYHYTKQQNKTAAYMNKKLPDRIQAGRMIPVVGTTTSRAREILATLGGNDPEIIATDKGKKLAALLLDLTENPNEYIPDKAFELPSNRKAIENYLSELGLISKAKKDLYSIL